ncbi:ATP-binding protein [Clostridium sp. Marseille-Q7071]
MINIKSLRGKITLIYIGLVMIITIVGLISVFNVYKLERSIDGLITDNYKSIDAANNMNNYIEAQDKAILKYMQNQKKEAVNLFYESNDMFYKWFHTERNNVTEVREAEIVEELNVNYINFIKLFPELQEYSKTHNYEQIQLFYREIITPVLEDIKKNLNDLSKLNEVTMFDKKNSAKINAENSTNIILIASSISTALGLIISIIYTNKYLRPIHLLTDTVKSVKEGEINKQAPIIYNDEIGMLATEFNNMTNRLYEFEKSTKGTLLAEKNRSMTIVKSISDPLIVLDASFKIKFINNSCETFFNLKEDYVLNKHFLQVIKNSELYDYAFEVINNDLIDDGKIIDIAMKNKTYFFNVTVTPIKDKDLKVNGVIMLFRNVTELKQLEMIKTDFIGTISHELKTPLTSVMMGVGLMSDVNIGTLNQKQSKIIETIKEDVHKLNDLVSNLLKISQLQSDRAILDIKPCNIIDLINNCVNNYISQAEEKQINLHYEVCGKLPNIMVDEEKIIWVLNNLVSNAIRYTENKGKILIGTYTKNEEMYVYIKDTGRGIPEQYLNKVFEKFVRVEGFEILPESNGLGLSIAKEIVEVHGGEIWCESKLNEGSIFTFTLPIEED